MCPCSPYGWTSCAHAPRTGGPGMSTSVLPPPLLACPLHPSFSSYRSTQQLLIGYLGYARPMPRKGLCWQQPRQPLLPAGGACSPAGTESFRKQWPRCQTIVTALGAVRGLAAPGRWPQGMVPDWVVLLQTQPPLLLFRGPKPSAQGPSNLGWVWPAGRLEPGQPSCALLPEASRAGRPWALQRGPSRCSSPCDRLAEWEPKEQKCCPPPIPTPPQSQLVPSLSLLTLKLGRHSSS